MDGIAKFLGYLVLAFVALAWLGSHAEKETLQTVAPAAAQPPRDRCKELATAQLVQRIAPDLLKKTHDFGENIEPAVVSCKDYGEEETMQMSLRVGWNGPFTGDYYEKVGRLTVQAQGWRWEETGANENLRGYRLLVGIAGLLAAASDASTPPKPSEVAMQLSNACDHPVRLAVRYQDARGRWRTEGWWSVDAGRTEQLLLSDSQAVRAPAATLYYYAETTDDSALAWKGDHAHEFDGRALPMRELVAGGSRSWQITCS